MKKSLFLMAAASALMLTACTSEDDVLQSSAPQKVEAKALGFDVYMPQAVTRAGNPEGVMNTDKLKTENMGFGVFAFHHDNVASDPNYPANNTSLFPNFMYNEHISWTTAGGWIYSPLKYWPNETIKDSQTDNGPADTPESSNPRIDRLSFFAYAPYVATDATPLNIKDPSGTPTMVTDRTDASETNWTKVQSYHGSENYGITAISAEELTSDPLVEWASYYKLPDHATNTPYNTILDHNVDLLWGVAPAGLSYTSVNGTNCSATFGKPIIDMVKPDKDQKIKFLFQHALSRIGLSVVSAIDQIAAGDDGGKFTTDQTRVLISEVTVWGDFGTQGVLNLNNSDANVANWIWTSVDRTASTASDPILLVNTTNGYLANDLRYDAGTISTITGTIGTATDGNVAAFSTLNEGVLPSEKQLINGGPDPSREVVIPSEGSLAYVTGTTLYKANGNDYEVVCVEPATACDVYIADGKNWKQIGTSGACQVMDGSKEYYNISATQCSAGSATVGTSYYTRETVDGKYYYTFAFEGTSSGDGSTITTDNYTIAQGDPLTGKAYSTAGTYYKGLMPRYFMVIPSEPSLDGSKKTNIYVKIKYNVVTKDEKLADFISNIENEVTKKISMQLESGKSYNLKLILGLTSVKLDAVVGEWQVGDGGEVWLPQNK